MPNKINKLKKFQSDKDLAFFESILDLQEQAELARDVMLKGLGELNSVDFDLVKGEKGDRGEDGETPDPQEIAQGVLSMIPKPENGKDGKPGKDGVSPNVAEIVESVMGKVKLPKDGKDGKPGENGSPDKPMDIRNKLESLRDEDRLQIGAIDLLDSKLRELQEFQENMANKDFRIKFFGGGGDSGGGTGAVDSVFGRTAAVTAQTGDYTAAQVTNAVSSLYTAVVTDLGNQATTVAMDVAVSPNYTVTLTGNATLAVTNVATAPFKKYSIVVTQDATGSRTLTMPASVKTAGGAGITLSTAANAVDIISIMTDDNGTTLYAEVNTNFA